ncbi:MAG: flagellar motor switch protein FliN [Spirochaetaceae bacterium]|nr:MAG: flagellar motor switch protein FliN [Spirochaetaceae bacterium]
MSDGSLSQDEIDALLQGSGGMDFAADEPAAPSGGGGGSQVDLEGLKRILASTVESQKSNLSMLVGKDVTITGPEMEMGSGSDIAGSLGGDVVHIGLAFGGGVRGDHGYLMPESAALAIAGPMMGQDDVDLDDAALNALQEALSQVSGPVVTALADSSGKDIMNEPPSNEKGDPDTLSVPAQIVAARYTVTIEGGDPAGIVEYYDAALVPQLFASQAPPQQQQQQPQQHGQQGAMAGFGGGMDGYGGGAPQQQMQPGTGPSVQSVQFPNLHPQDTAPEHGNIGLLMDVYMEMTVELGRTKKLIREILGMGEGTIIELDKLAGEPVDILVNHKLIAKGEVVVIDENFGVRVTEIVSPMERVTNMS